MARSPTYIFNVQPIESITLNYVIIFNLHILEFIRGPPRQIVVSIVKMIDLKVTKIVNYSCLDRRLGSR